MDIFYYSHNRIRNTDRLPATRLEYIDVTILLSGSMVYGYNHQNVTLHAGDAVVFSAGDVRERKEGGFAEYYSFNVRQEESDTLPHLSGIIRDCLSEETEKLLDLFQKSFSSGSRYEREKCGCFFQALYYNLSEQMLEKSTSPVIKTIYQYISDHLSEPITVKQIASAVFLTPNYCGFLFHAHTGVMLTEYITSMKMEEARKRILSSDELLSKIALSVGYSDYTYFSKLFKKYTGLPPARYRRVHSYNNNSHEKITDFTAKS